MHFRPLVSGHEVAQMLNLLAEVVGDKVGSADDYRAKRGFESGPHIGQRNTYAMGTTPTADTTPKGVPLAVSERDALSNEFGHLPTTAAYVRFSPHRHYITKADVGKEKGPPSKGEEALINNNQEW